MKYIPVLILSILSFTSCKKDDDTSGQELKPQLKFSLSFSDTLPRLGNLGEEVGVPSGHAAQSPVMHQASVHYIELASDSLTNLGDGEIVYEGEETAVGGEAAVEFDKANIGEDGVTFIEMDLSTLEPGTYNWLRVSLSYQNYDIEYRVNESPYIVNQDYTGRLASFVGFNNYITTHTIKDSMVTLNANKEQGYWAFESNIVYNNVNYSKVTQGDGAGVTVVNPINTTSPVPVGSCVVTGKLKEALVITGDEKEDIQMVLAFSINNSFEWEEVVEDGKYEPGAGETVQDMGLRGLHPYVKE